MKDCKEKLKEVTDRLRKTEISFKKTLQAIRRYESLRNQKANSRVMHDAEIELHIALSEARDILWVDRHEQIAC